LLALKGPPLNSLSPFPSRTHDYAPTPNALPNFSNSTLLIAILFLLKHAISTASSSVKSMPTVLPSLSLTSKSGYKLGCAELVCGRRKYVVSADGAEGEGKGAVGIVVYGLRAGWRGVEVVRLWAAALSIVVVKGEREEWRGGRGVGVGEEERGLDGMCVVDEPSSSQEWIGSRLLK